MSEHHLETLCIHAGQEPDPVSGAVRQIRNFVIRTKTCIDNNFACGRVDSLTRSADFRRGKAHIL